MDGSRVDMGLRSFSTSPVAPSPGRTSAPAQDRLQASANSSSAHILAGPLARPLLPRPEPAAAATGAAVTCDYYHQLIHQNGQQALTNLRQGGKIAGRVLAVAGGLGSGAGAGIVVAAALHLGVMAGVASTIMFPPVLVALVAVPLIGGVILGTLIRVQSRRLRQQSPQMQQQIASLRKIEAAFINVKRQLRQQGKSLGAGDEAVLQHATETLKKLRTWGVVGQDAARLSALGVVTGLFSGLLAALTVLVLASGEGCDGSGGGGGGGGGGDTVIIWNSYLYDRGPAFRFGGSKRQTEAASRRQQAQDRSGLTPAQIGVPPPDPQGFPVKF